MSPVHAARPVLIRTAELAVGLVVDHVDVGSSAAKRVGDRTGVVRGGIVDDDEFVVADLAVGHEHLADLGGEADRASDVVLFVPHREEDGEFGEVGRGSRSGS